MKHEVHYMRPSWFREGVTGSRPNPAQLSRTHVHLKDIDIASDKPELDRVFYEMQGEVWSPNGEARDIIRGKGLQHTSMSVGDVIVVEGVAYLVATMGFTKLERAA